MMVEKINIDKTIIEFDDEFIVENKTNTRKLDLELFIYNALDYLNNTEYL